MDQLRATLDAADEEERRLLHSRTMAARMEDLRTRWILGLGSGSLVVLLLLAGARNERYTHERKSAERVLADQAHLIDLSHDAIITTDGARVITRWNAGAQAMYGWTESEALGKVVHELLQTHNHVAVPEGDTLLFREGRWDGELEQVARDGRRLVVDCCQVLTRDEKGRPASILEINRDITERKEAEDALRAAHEELKAIYDNAPVLLTVVDENLRVRKMNEMARRFAGLDEEQRCGLSPGGAIGCLNALADPKGCGYSPSCGQCPIRLAALAAVHEGKRHEQIEASLTQSVEGERRTKSLLVSTTPIEFQRTKGALICLQDVTELKDTQRALDESEERLRFAAEAAGIGVWSWTPGTSDVVVSANWRRLFGISPDVRVTFETWREALHPDDRDNAVRELNLAVDQRREFGVEYRVVPTDGMIRWLADRGRASYDEHGRAIGMAGVNVDITELKRQAFALAESKSRQEVLAEVVGRLLASDEPTKIVNDLARKVMEKLDCHVFFNFLAYTRKQRLRLNAYAGIPEEAAREIEWLDYGSAVCGCVARDGSRIVAENIPDNPELRTDLVRFYGVKAYACHPLVAGGEVIGTLSFGSRTKSAFSADDLTLMQAVTSHVAIAMERVRAQRALSEAVKRYEQQVRLFDGVASTTPDFVYLFDLQGRFLYANRRLLQVLGMKLPEVIGKTYRELGYEQWHHDMHMREIGQVIETKRPIKGEVPFKAPRTGIFGVYEYIFTPVPSADGEVETIAGTTRDITERKHAEDALRLSEEKFAKAFATNPAAMAIARVEDGLLMDVNRAWQAITGYSRAEAVGHTSTDLHVWPTVEERDRYARELKEKGSVQGWEVIHRRKSGEPFVALLSGAKLTIGGEEMNLSALLDISDRKRAEQEVRQLNTELENRVRERTAQLEAANKELEAFAYSVSHDLRAPLRGIDGWSLALVEDYASRLDERAKQYLERVRSETQRMGHLIDDLLQLSRITRTEMHRDAVDLSRTAETIALRLREAHAERRLEFVIRPGLVAYGDARLLEVALTNLLHNAVKFTGPRAHARIDLEAATSCDGNRAFVVRDNGVGFDMAYAGTLFGAFQRLHSDSEFPGTGIGLATVQRIIHRHGGRIWAAAEPGRGAAFYFTLGGEK
jgi:PAS domain S-box-containing protein